MKPLLERIEKGQIRSQLHHFAPYHDLMKHAQMYKIWRDKKEKVTEIVIDPWAV